jgi:polyisoprenoid-binding protein YceI
VDLHLRFSTALLGLAVLVEFRIDLSGADTGVGIRDERLRSTLLNVRATPQAIPSSQIDRTMIQDLPATGLRDFDLNGQLTLAGQSKPVSAKLRIGRMGAETVLASTRRPIVVNAADFGLRPGVEAMRDAMGLGFLSSSAPVSFALLLREQR